MGRGRPDWSRHQRPIRPGGGADPVERHPSMPLSGGVRAA